MIRDRPPSAIFDLLVDPALSCFYPSMDSGFATFIGALVGAIAAIGGSLLSQSLQARGDGLKWQREQRNTAYTNTIRYTLRVIAKRSDITADGETLIKTEHIKELFDDYAEIQSGLTMVSLYCGVAQRKAILRLRSDVNDSIRLFLNRGPIGPGRLSATGFIYILPRVYEELVECAQKDLV